MSSNSFRTQRTTVFLLSILFLLFAISCEMDDASIPDEGKPESILERIERGPALITLETDRKEISIAERLYLTISVTINEDYEIHLPTLGPKLDRFSIVDYRTTGPALVDNNRIKVSRLYVLEPFLSGDYTIPPMIITFWRDNGQEDNFHEVETPEATVKVNSLLSENIAEAKLNDIKPPVPFPRASNLWLWSGLCAIVLLICASFVFSRKREKPAETSPEKILSPHELAYLELDNLLKEDLINKGEVKLFYQRISWILRCYIENRFGIHAPEQTTEEFLSGVEFEYNLPGKYKPLLKTFLKQCDCVKFAEHQPRSEEIQKALYSCRAFIDGTKIKGSEGYAL